MPCQWGDGDRSQPMDKDYREASGQRQQGPLGVCERKEENRTVTSKKGMKKTSLLTWERIQIFDLHLTQ